MTTTTAVQSTTSDSYAWIGSSGGNWGTPSNWDDTTSNANPALFVPGTLTPATIAGPTGSTFEVIVGGGAASSLMVSGNVSTSGSYAVGGLLSVGEVAVSINTNPQAPFVAGALALGANSTLSVGTIDVASGTLSAATGVIVNAGSVAVGSPYGSAYSLNGSAAYGYGSAGSLSFASGSTFTALAALRSSAAICGFPAQW